MISLKGGASWSVHQSMLCKSPILARKCNEAQQQILDFSHVAESTAHVLVHYLYTGAYQSYEPEIPLGGPRIANLRAALSVYTMSRNFALPGLEAAVKDRIELLGENVAATDKLDAAREAYSNLDETDAWFLHYLKNCIRSLVEDDSSLSYRDLNFLGDVSSFVKTIVKSAVEIYSEQLQKNQPLNASDKQYAENQTTISEQSFHESGNYEATALEVSQSNRSQNINNPAGVESSFETPQRTIGTRAKCDDDMTNMVFVSNEDPNSTDTTTLSIITDSILQTPVEVGWQATRLS